MDRRCFLRTGATAASACWVSPLFAAPSTSERAMVVTVTGRISADELGATLPHEHVLVDFVGADRVSRERYDQDEVFAAVLPQLKTARRAGCQSLVECTPNYLGRDPLLLKRLAEASGMSILTNTGYYGAREGKYLPEHAFTESADQLAARWIDESRNGIEGIGIRPGFIKIGVDGGSLTDVNRKLVQAAARTHLQTGLTIASHTGDGQAAIEQLECLTGEGVDPSAWIWVHAQNERNLDLQVRAARQGAWVEFDGVGPESLEQHVRFVKMMREQGLLDRVLISHDAGWYSVGEPRGGSFRPYDTLFAEFLPALRSAGLSADDVLRLTVTNPARAFTVGARVRLKNQD